MDTVPFAWQDALQCGGPENQFARITFLGFAIRVVCR